MITSSMSGSRIDRSATSWAAATAATIGAALASAGKVSHWRGPSTLLTVAPGTSSGRRGSTRSTTSVRSSDAGACRPASARRTRAAVVDHHHPAAQLLDVVQVVGREQHGQCRSRVDPAQELAQPGLADHVEADRRLVEVEDLGVVQQRGRDVAAHPLARATAGGPGCRGTSPGRAGRRTVEVAAVAGRRRRGRCGAAGRTSRAAADPTTASCAARRPRRCAGPARRARGDGSRPATRQPARRWAPGCRSAS